MESGKLRFEDGEWHRPSTEDLETPQGIQVSIESRLYKLAEQVQGTLRMAAVLGREFEFSILLQALEFDEDALIEALKASEDAQMIQELGGRGAIAVRANPADFLALAQEGQQAVQGLKEGPGLAHLLERTASAYIFNGQMEEGLRFGQRALDMAQKFNIPAV